jgi:hypothetical protein
MEFNFINTFLLLSGSYLFANWFIELKPSSSKEEDLKESVPLKEFRRTLWKETPELYANFDKVFCRIIDHYENGVHVSMKDTDKSFGCCRNGYLILNLDITLHLLRKGLPVEPFAED